MLSIDPGYLSPDISDSLIAAQAQRVAQADRTVTERSGPGSDFLGWLDPDAMVTSDELALIEAIATELRSAADILVVVGIGGSYLGARAVIEALQPTGGPAVRFAGQNLSARHHADLLAEVTGQRTAVNVVSKSGTTTEPAVAFRLLKAHMERVYGKDAAARIVATTDRRRGALRQLADGAGYRTLPIADDVGGRYSVLSPVGLLPIAFAGIDIRALRQGAIDCCAACANPSLAENPARYYAATRNLLYQQGFGIEALASFEPRLHFVLEWWKQLYGESEGKNHMGLYPSSVEFTTDLHSMGQYFQDGRRFLAETFLVIDDGEPEVLLPEGDDRDELGYLVGRPLTRINDAAHAATARAHRDGGVPNQTIHLPRLDAYHLGALLYFFERACAISGYLMGINPFDQPGVEAYKTNMFGLLGKPGYAAPSEDGRPSARRISFSRP